MSRIFSQKITLKKVVLISLLLFIVGCSTFYNSNGDNPKNIETNEEQNVNKNSNGS